MIARHLKLKTNRKPRKMLEAYLWRLTDMYNWTIRTTERELADCKALAEGPLPEFQERLGGKNKVRLKPLRLNTSEFSLDMRLTRISKRMGVPNRAIQGAARTARLAWDRCLKGLGGRPKFKGARNRLNSILFGGDCELSKLDNTIGSSGLGDVRRVRIPVLKWKTKTLDFSAFLEQKQEHDRAAARKKEEDRA